MTPITQLNALRAHRTPVDEREAAAWDEVATFLQTPPADSDTVHITAAGIVVSERGVMLLQHKRLGIWVQPGGHIEANEAPHRAALRESREETGLAIRHPAGGPRLIHIDAHDGGRGHRHYDFRYLLKGLGTTPRPPHGESQQVRWCTPDEAIGLADDGLVGLFRACPTNPINTFTTHLYSLSVPIT
ncbi:NUDIX hydrolase [Stomatohabitans albus]|uniref:NUDIX hydrolase n=1 Tax=Stomatohabitans albus TaxID=3110766 RepID=UPI00300DA2D2